MAPFLQKRAQNESSHIENDQNHRIFLQIHIMLQNHQKTTSIHRLKEISSSNFGLLIAFVLPGFTALTHANQ